MILSSDLRYIHPVSNISLHLLPVHHPFLFLPPIHPNLKRPINVCCTQASIKHYQGESDNPCRPFLRHSSFPRPPYTALRRYDIVWPRQSRIRRCAGQCEPCHWVVILGRCRLSHISLHRIQSYKFLLMLRCSTPAPHINNFSTFHSLSEDSINTTKEAMRLHTTLTPSMFRSLFSNLPPPSTQIWHPQISQTPL